MRATALSICGSKNGSARDFRRGRRKFSTSPLLANPLRKSSRAMHCAPQISLHEIGLPLSSSGGAMIHRLCTDHLNRCRFPDKACPARRAIALAKAGAESNGSTMKWGTREQTYKKTFRQAAEKDREAACAPQKADRVYNLFRRRSRLTKKVRRAAREKQGPEEISEELGSKCRLMVDTIQETH